MYFFFFLYKGEEVNRSADALFTTQAVSQLSCSIVFFGILSWNYTDWLPETIILFTLSVCLNTVKSQ